MADRSTKTGTAIRSRCCWVVADGLFDVLPPHVELEIVRVIDTPKATATAS